MDTAVKYAILFILALIVVSLGRGIYFLAKDDGSADKTRVVKALTIRIALSIALFLLLMLGNALGLLQPHGQ